MASASMRSTDDVDRETHQLLDLGMQYYLTGRFAVQAGQIPVCGNLLHHAIEMLLKAALVRKHTLNELRGLGHDLGRLWQALKAEFRSGDLDAFDPVITELGPFERLRYPDHVLVEGMAAWVEIERPAAVPVQSAECPPAYRLIVSDVDRLVVALFDCIPRNPAYFTAGLSPSAREALFWNNPVAEALLPSK